MTTTTNKPIITITDLNLTPEEIAEVRRIQTAGPITQRNDRIKRVLGCSLCCVDNEIPTKKVTTALEGVIRTESYCDKCFETRYERTPMNRAQLAERWNCTIAPENYFGRSKRFES